LKVCIATTKKLCKNHHICIFDFHYVIKNIKTMIFYFWIYPKFIVSSHSWNYNIILCTLQMNLPNVTTSSLPPWTYMDMKMHINFTFSKPPPPLPLYGTHCYALLMTMKWQKRNKDLHLKSLLFSDIYI